MKEAHRHLSTIHVDDIEPGKRARAPGNIEELKNSIAESGIVVPLGVLIMKGNEDKISWKSSCHYLLLHGGRRLAAARMLGLDEVPCLIFDRKMADEEAWNIELIENLHRKNMAWAEEVELQRKIHDGYIKKYGEKKSTSKDAKGWTKTRTAEVLGINASNIGVKLIVAEAIVAIPTLATLKSKSDALAVLNKSVETVERRRIVEKIEEKQANTPTAKYKKDLASRYIIGTVDKDPLKSGFFIGVLDIPDGTIDLVEIDPPYAIDLDAQKKGGDTGIVMHGYNEIDESIYTPFLDKVLLESFRVLKDSGWCILWFGPEPWFEPSFNALIKANFKVRRIPGVWIKGGGQTMAPNIYLANSYEMFHYARKGKAEIVQKGRANIFNFAPVPIKTKIHPTERPIEMIQEVLTTFAEPGSKIMVPFLGGATTILAADNIQMTAFGWDLTKDYKNEYILRIEGKTTKEGKFHSY